MGKVYDAIDERWREWIAQQHMFFVSTAPAQGGHVNCSPKGMDTFRVLGPREVAYLDFVGSGAETVAHLRENGRITLMFCAFDGPPKIFRIHGRGEAVEPGDPSFAALAREFPQPERARSIIRVEALRISDSCGYGVPLMTYTGERTQMDGWAERQGPEGLRKYQLENNLESLDGLPALHAKTIR